MIGDKMSRGEMKLTIAESITKAGCGVGRAYVSSHVTRAETTANGWPDGRSIYHTMAESSIE